MARATRAVRFEFEGDMSDLNKALAEIPETTKRQVAATAKVLQKKIEFDGMRDELAALPGVTRAAANKMARELQKVPDEAKTRFAGLADLIKAELSADLIRESVVGFKDYVVELQEARLETIRFADATGIGLDTLGGLELAFKRSGADFEKFRDASADFGEVMFDFAEGGGRAAEAFELLDVKVRDTVTGALRPTDEVMREVLRKLPLMANDVERVAVAQQFWSDSGLDAATSLKKLPIDKAIADARELGTVLDEELVASTKAWANANELARESLLDLSNSASFLPSVGGILFNLATAFDVFKNIAVGAAGETVEGLTQLKELITAFFTGDLPRFAEAARFAFEGPVRFVDLFNDSVEETADRIRDIQGEIQDVPAISLTFAEIEEGKFVGPTIEAEKLKDRLKEIAEEEREIAKARRESAAAARKAASAERARDAAAKKAADEQVAAAKEVLDARLEALDARFSAEERLVAVQADATSDTISDERRIQNELAVRLNAIGEIQQAIGETEKTRAAADAANARAAREITAVRVAAAKEAADKIKQADQDIADHRMEVMQNASFVVGQTFGTAFRGIDQLLAISVQKSAEAIQSIDDQLATLEASQEEGAALAEERVEALQKKIEEARQEGDADRVQSLKATIGGIEAEEAAREAQIESEIEAQEKKREKERIAAINNFLAQKNAQRALAVVDAARAAIALIPSFAFLAAGAPAAAATVAAGGLAIQLAVIGSQQPPSFHAGGVIRQGGSPDEVGITGLSDEGMVNRRGMNQLGEEGLNALNNGQMPMSVTVQLIIDRRIIQEEVFRIMNRVATTSLGTSGRAFRKPAYQGQGL